MVTQVIDQSICTAAQVKAKNNIYRLPCCFLCFDRGRTENGKK